jgi:hypothetical protein
VGANQPKPVVIVVPVGIVVVAHGGAHVVVFIMIRAAAQHANASACAYNTAAGPLELPTLCHLAPLLNVISTREAGTPSVPTGVLAPEASGDFSFRCAPFEIT